MRLIALLIVLSLVMGCTQISPKVSEVKEKGFDKEKFCDKLWRYDLDCALKRLPTEAGEVKWLAEKLKGKSCAETAWNVLKWVDENIKYDSVKASYPPPVVEIHGNSVKIVSGKERFYQTPAETVALKKGICGDYALLIAALLIDSNCSAYVFNISFTDNSPNHVASAVKIDGHYYILDQHLPPLDTGGYAYKWRKEGKTLKDARVYEIGREVKFIGNIGKFDDSYGITADDIAFLKNRISEMIESKYGLKFDPKLGKSHTGYRFLKTYRVKLSDMAEYYSPPFKNEIASFVLDKVLQKEVSDTLKKARAFGIDVGVSGEDLIVTLYAAG